MYAIFIFSSIIFKINLRKENKNEKKNQKNR